MKRILLALLVTLLPAAAAAAAAAQDRIDPQFCAEWLDGGPSPDQPAGPPPGMAPGRPVPPQMDNPPPGPPDAGPRGWRHGHHPPHDMPVTADLAQRLLLPAPPGVPPWQEVGRLALDRSQVLFNGHPLHRESEWRLRRLCER